MYESIIKSVVLERKSTTLLAAEIYLPASKSESNRALILSALCNNKSALDNLSHARDTQTLQSLLTSEDQTLDVLDAGTAMRFLAAYCAIKRPNTLLTGTDRMKQRPLLPLTQALQTLGCQIEFESNTGYAPLRIGQFKYSGIHTVGIRADISSQFVSALLMIGPCLPDGLKIMLEGRVGSLPYILMTIEQMRAFGADAFFDQSNATITVAGGGYSSCSFSVESDWSAASYWYGIMALCPVGSSLMLKGLKQNSLQGDHIIMELMKALGVRTVFENNAAYISKTEILLPKTMDINFQDCPDLAQTMAVVCSALGIILYMRGVSSLHIKETDRVLALKQELGQFGIGVHETDAGVFEIKGKFAWPASMAFVHTYQDHRMAMSFGMLSVLGPLQIQQPSVVQKSYPDFWLHLSDFGIKTEFIDS